MPAYLRKLRSKVGNELLHVPSVTIICFDDIGRVLLVNHAEGVWVAPGGSVEPPEFLADAAVREMAEETGLLVEPENVLGVYGGPEFHVTYANGDQVSYLMTVFVCRVIGGDPQPDRVETLDVRYIAESELAHLNMPTWMHLVMPDVFADVRKAPCLHALTTTWQPPTDHLQPDGMVAYMRRIRPMIGKDLLMISAAAGLVFDEQGRVLLQKRKDNGLWELPGGAIAPDESPVDATVREVWEETGVLVEPARLSGVYGGNEIRISQPYGEEIAVIGIVFECRAIGGRPQSDGVESADVGYFLIDELDESELSGKWRRAVDDAKRQPASTYFEQATEEL